MAGVVNAITGIFRIYASGKTFVATYKQGKKSWESGEGWGKTFLLIGASIFAVINIGQMAAQGSEMIAADQAQNADAANIAKNASEESSSGGLNEYDGDLKKYDIVENGIGVGDVLPSDDGIKWTVEDLGNPGGYPKSTNSIRVSTMLPDGTPVYNFLKWEDIYKGPKRVKQIIDAFNATYDFDWEDYV